MEQQIESPVSTELPGSLYLAPFGTKPPESAVANGRYVADWPVDGWRRMCLTDPDRAQYQHDAAGVMAGSRHPAEHVWRFGLEDADLDNFAALADPVVAVAVGWESTDGRVREGIPAAQLYVDWQAGEVVFAASRQPQGPSWWSRAASSRRS